MNRLASVLLAIAASLLALAAPASAQNAYQPITADPEAAGTTITLTGRDLTIEDVVAVARRGAKVRFAPEVYAANAARRELIAQGDEEGIAIYGVNRGAGALREQERRPQPGTQSDGNPARYGALPEIHEEALVRAFLVIHANHMPYGTGEQDYLDAILELLNRRVTPVMYSRGSLSEGDLFIFNSYQATLKGRGYAYYEGRRMPAAEALAKADLKPFQGHIPHLTTNAYTDAIAALLVDEGRHALEWADMALAIDLIGMNSSLTPMAPPVQQEGPFPWLNWQADKMLTILRGSYLFEDDSDRILQDPESMRASYIRLGSAWRAWARLRDSVTLQMNSGENNPGYFVGVEPGEHWSLSTPWMMRNYVRGGGEGGAPSGYIFSNANWDAYPMTNDIEAFSLALANMAVTIPQRIEKFSDRGPVAFFTKIKPADVLTPDEYDRSPYLIEPFFTYLDVWKEMQMLTQSVPPDTSVADFGVADLEGMGRLKGARAREAVDLLMQLMAYDVMTGTYWMDVRLAQQPGRTFGSAPTAAWQAVREVVPWQMDPDERPDVPPGVLVYGLMKERAASEFMPAIADMPEGE